MTLRHELEVMDVKKDCCCRSVGLGDDPERGAVGGAVDREETQAELEGLFVLPAIVVVNLSPIASCVSGECHCNDVDEKRVASIGRDDRLTHWEPCGVQDASFRGWNRMVDCEELIYYKSAGGLAAAQGE